MKCRASSYAFIAMGITGIVLVGVCLYSLRRDNHHTPPWEVNDLLSETSTRSLTLSRGLERCANDLGKVELANQFRKYNDTLQCTYTNVLAWQEREYDGQTQRLAVVCSLVQSTMDARQTLYVMDMACCQGGRWQSLYLPGGLSCKVYPHWPGRKSILRAVAAVETEADGTPIRRGEADWRVVETELDRLKCKGNKEFWEPNWGTEADPRSTNSSTIETK